MFNQRGAVAAVYRLIPERIRPFEELGCRRSWQRWPIVRAVSCW